MKAKTKVTGTIYGSNLKKPGYYYLEDKEDGVIVYYDNDGTGYDDTFNFVEDRVEPELTWKMIRECKGISFGVTHLRNYKENLVLAGKTLADENIYIGEKEPDAFGGTTIISLVIKDDNKVILGRAVCHPRDQYCRVRGIEYTIAGLSKEDREYLLNFIRNNS